MIRWDDACDSGGGGGGGGKEEEEESLFKANAVNEDPERDRATPT